MPDYVPVKDLDGIVGIKRCSYQPPDMTDDSRFLEAGQLGHGTFHTPFQDVGDVMARVSMGLTFFDKFDGEVCAGVPLYLRRQPIWLGQRVFEMATYTVQMRPLHASPKKRLGLCAHECLPAKVAFKIIEYTVHLDSTGKHLAKQFSRDPPLSQLARRSFVAAAMLGMDLDADGGIGECVQLFDSFLQTDIGFEMLWDKSLDIRHDHRQSLAQMAEYKASARHLVETKLLNYIKLFLQAPGGNRLLHVLDPTKFLAPYWMNLDADMEASMAADIRTAVLAQKQVRRAAWLAKLAADAQKLIDDEAARVQKILDDEAARVQREAGMQVVLYRPITFWHPVPTKGSSKRAAECAPAEGSGRAVKRPALGTLKVNTLGQSE